MAQVLENCGDDTLDSERDLPSSSEGSSSCEIKALGMLYPSLDEALADYRIVSSRGRGKDGEVWRAEIKATGQKVAIKFVENALRNSYTA